MAGLSGFGDNSEETVDRTVESVTTVVLTLMVRLIIL